MTAVHRAAFIAIGTEMLRTERVDSNSSLAVRLLAPCGVELVEKRIIGDDVATIAGAIRELVGRVEILLLSGGLGPTADDVTREAVSAALGIALRRDATIEARLAERYRLRNRPFPEIARRMADVLEGAEALPNPVGSAPGQLVAMGPCVVVLLPGVPSELEAILQESVVPRWAGAAPLRTRTLRLAGTYESAVEERVSHLYERFGRENVTILAGRGHVTLLLAASGDGAEARLDEMDEAFSRALGEDLFARTDVSLAEVVLDRLSRRRWRLALAESCTGGLIAANLVAEPGASDVLLGGVVAYANELKSRLLDVPAGLIAAYGAVSRQVAEAMATGAANLGAHCAIAVTGIAGPTGGTADKPVGTVHIAVKTPNELRHAQHLFPGNRALVRELSAVFALDLLRRCLEE
jgi:nicotinamide-nucleotide amidase